MTGEPRARDAVDLFPILRGKPRPDSGTRAAGARWAQSGQAALMVLAVAGATLLAALLLFAFGNALGARGKYQRAADLAAVGAAQTMRELYPRLFEPPFLEPGVPNPRHLAESTYRALARAAAVRGARRNGARIRPTDVSFPSESFAATRVTVRVRAEAPIHAPGDRAAVPMEASATAELTPGGGTGLDATGGGYKGPLAHRQGKPMRPDVALAFDRMATAARREAGLFLLVTSGLRSDAEQAVLFAANPDPRWVAPPGESLTAMPRSSISARRPRTRGSPRTPRASASSAATRTSPGTSATPGAPAARRSASARAAATAEPPAPCSRSSPPASPR